MSTDEVRRAFQVASVEVQVAAAEGCGGNFEDSVCGLLDLGIRAVFYGDLVLTVSILSLKSTTEMRSLALKSLLSTTARIVSGGVKPIVATGLNRGRIVLLSCVPVEYA